MRASINAFAPHSAVAATAFQPADGIGSSGGGGSGGGGGASASPNKHTTNYEIRFFNSVRDRSRATCSCPFLLQSVCPFFLRLMLMVLMVMVMVMVLVMVMVMVMVIVRARVRAC